MLKVTASLPEFAKEYLAITRVLRQDSYYLEELQQTVRAMNARLAEGSHIDATFVATATAQKHSEVLFDAGQAIVILDAQELYFLLAFNYNYLSQEPARLRALFLGEVVECLCCHLRYDSAANLLDYLRRTDESDPDLNSDVQVAAGRIANLQLSFTLTHELTHFLLRRNVDNEHTAIHRTMFATLSKSIASNALRENEKIEGVIRGILKRSGLVEEGPIEMAPGLLTNTSTGVGSVVDAARAQAAINDRMANLPSNLGEEILCDMYATSTLLKQFCQSEATLVYAVRASYLAISGITSLKYVRSFVDHIHEEDFLNVWRYNDPDLVVRLTFISAHIEHLLHALPVSERAVAVALQELSRLRDSVSGFSKVLDVGDWRRVWDAVCGPPPDAPDDKVRSLMREILLCGLN